MIARSRQPRVGSVSVVHTAVLLSRRTSSLTPPRHCSATRCRGASAPPGHPPSRCARVTHSSRKTRPPKSRSMSLRASVADRLQLFSVLPDDDRFLRALVDEDPGVDVAQISRGFELLDFDRDRIGRAPSPRSLKSFSRTSSAARKRSGNVVISSSSYIRGASGRGFTSSPPARSLSPLVAETGTTAAEFSRTRISRDERQQRTPCP